MQKNSAKKPVTHSQYDLYNDMLKIKDVFSDTAKDVKGKATEVLSQSLDNIKEKTSDIQGTMTDYVAERPIKSLGLALLSGYLLGALMMRKKIKYPKNP